MNTNKLKTYLETLEEYTKDQRLEIERLIREVELQDPIDYSRVYDYVDKIFNNEDKKEETNDENI